MKTTRNRIAVLSTVGVLAFGTAACGGEEEPLDAGAAQEEVVDEEVEEEPEEMPTEEPTEMAAEPVDGPFGPGCSAVPAEGAGSFEGMSSAPVATAASNNPVLSTLVTAVGAAGLGDTLNSSEAVTVFAPSNDAFAAIPEADLNALLADKEALTNVLTYHVVGERIAPEDLSGEFETLAGEMLTVEGEVPELTVGENDAQVVCGGVETANATVYIIDSVLMPPAA